MSTKQLAYGIYSYAEILSRLITATSPLEGPSGYPVSIHFDADNSTEPPVIQVMIYEGGAAPPIYSNGIDQNTTLNGFENILSDINDVVSACIEADNRQVSYSQFQREKRDVITPQREEEDFLPF